MTVEPVASVSSRLAQLFQADRARVLAAWRARVLGEMPAHAGRAQIPILDAVVPPFLEWLVRALEQCGDDRERSESLGRALSCADLDRARGEDRAREGYSVPSALRELAVLRTTLTETGAQLGLPCGHPAAMLLAAAFEAMTARLVDDLVEASNARGKLDARLSRHAVLLRDIGMALTGTDTLRGLLQRCAEATVVRLDAAFARIWTLDVDARVLVLEASAGMYTHLDGPHGRVPVGSFKIGRIASTRRAHLTNAVADDPEIGDPAWAAREGMTAFAGYPLLVEDRLVGVLAVFARHTLPDDTLGTLRTVASSIAVGIDRRRVRGALEARDHQLTTTLRSIGDAVVSTDAEGRVAFMNPVAVALTGWTLEEARGEPMSRVFDIIHEDTRATVGSPVDAVLRDGKIVELANHTLLRRRDGTSVAIEDSAAPIRDAQGEVMGVVLVFRDVTAKKRTEAERAQLFAEVERARAEAEAERQKLHELFMQAPVAVSIHRGPAHTYTFANTAYRALIGDRDVVGKTFADALPEIVGQGFHALLDQVFATGTPYVGIEQPAVLRRNGREETGYFNFVYAPNMDATGDIVGITECATEVTDGVLARLRVEALAAQLQESESRLRLVLDGSRIGTWSLELANQEVVSDVRFRDLFGLPADEPFTLARGLEIIHPDDSPLVARAVEDALAGKDGGTYVAEYRTTLLSDGSHRWVEARGQRVVGPDGVPVRLLGTGMDITERKQATLERDRIATQRTEVLESMGDAFFALDGAWRIVLVNRNLERVSRRLREEILGRDFWEAFPDAANPASLYFQNYHRCMTDRLPVQFVDYYPDLDLWTDVRAYPTEAGGIAVFFRDVSMQKRAEASLLRQGEFEKQLLGIVSHDLRNPLTAIAMSATLLTRQAGLEDRALGLAKRILSATARSVRLIDELLDFTQARLGGGIPIVRGPANFHEVTRGVLEEVREAHPDGALEIQAVGDGAGHWDAGRLAQVVQNLVTNALKYGTPATPVAVSTRGTTDEVTLMVHNIGAPIAPHRVAHIFEPMQRGTDAVDMVTRSVGLGLYIVQSIVTAHGGTIAVTSNAEEGTTFTVRLPRA